MDSVFYIVWARFRMMRRYLAHFPEEERRIFRILDLVSRGAEGHGQVHLLLTSAENGSAWEEEERGWVRAALLPQHFFSAILEAWHLRVTAQLAERKGFRSVEFADVKGSLQLLNSFHLRERDKMLLRAILSGGVWNGFLLDKAKKEEVPCRFCGGRDGDGHLFWECTLLLSPSPPSLLSSPILHVRELPEFMSLMAMDRRKLAPLSSLARLAAWS